MRSRFLNTPAEGFFDLAANISISSSIRIFMARDFPECLLFIVITFLCVCVLLN